MEISLIVSELGCEQEFLEKYKRGIIWKQIKGKQSFLCTTCRLDLINIPITLHEDILDVYRLSYGVSNNVYGQRGGWTNRQMDFFFV